MNWIWTFDTRRRAAMQALLIHRPSSYTCNGASERIFDHCLFRSSAPTTLVSLDPMGSPFLLMRTQALSSNLMRLPSFRCSSFRARTTTACLISPRRTLFDMLEPGVPSAKDRCFWTTTIILSPTRCQLRQCRRVDITDLSSQLAFFSASLRRIPQLPRQNYRCNLASSVSPH